MDTRKRFVPRIFCKGWADTISPLREKRWKLLQYAFAFGVGAIISLFVGGPNVLKDYLITSPLAGSGAALGWHIVVLLWNIVSAPAKIIHELDNDLLESQNRIEAFEEKLSKKNIKVERGTRVIRKQTDSELRVIIRNDSNSKLHNYYALIEDVLYKGADGIVKNTDFPSNLHLRWPSEIEEEERTNPISPGDTATIALVAIFEEDAFSIVIKELHRHEFNDAGLYSIVFRVGGMVDDVGIFKKIRAEIDFKGGREITINNLNEVIMDGDR